MEIKLSKKMGKDVYKFLPMTDNMPMKPKAITVDPFERNQIYIGTSKLMGMSFGEGVFAKRTIPGITHCLHRFLDGRKTSRFYFSIPGLRRILRNPKQQKKFNSR